ncbi:stage II sporulation protein M [Thermococcus sp. 101 C5]|uniref:stage II sporulation protein M n=1 Tax=Thermococcus TaxID=2263 RepID=UPI00128E755E|nr:MULTISPECIES: stage II sporulation protein M [Thermococcus]MCA6213509.1 stage II sporulation protein M [Thermococcus bergensis]MPW38480.1 stage II sporulation protein M [Thermococcus sp. 101 C5]
MKDNTKPLLLSFLLFFIGLFLGVTLSIHYEVHENVNIAPFLERELNEGKLSFSYIFKNNLKVSLLLSFGGALTFGGLTFLNLVFNGMNLGVLFYEALASNDIGIFLLLILPHGIFEIPGLIIAGSAGFKIPYELLKFALGKKEEIISEEDAKEFFKLVVISIVLILIAAIIESKITLKLAEKL